MSTCNEALRVGSQSIEQSIKELQVMRKLAADWGEFDHRVQALDAAIASLSAAETAHPVGDNAADGDDLARALWYFGHAAFDLARFKEWLQLNPGNTGRLIRALIRYLPTNERCGEGCHYERSDPVPVLGSDGLWRSATPPSAPSTAGEAVATHACDSTSVVTHETAGEAVAAEFEAWWVSSGRGRDYADLSNGAGLFAHDAALAAWTAARATPSSASSSAAVDVLRIPAQTGLDPITVYFDDAGDGRGRMTIACYGEAWATAVTSAWGAMGPRTVREFVAGVDPSYLSGALCSLRPGTTVRDRSYVHRIARAVIEAVRAEAAPEVAHG